MGSTHKAHYSFYSILSLVTYVAALFERGDVAIEVATALQLHQVCAGLDKVFSFTASSLPQFGHVVAVWVANHIGVGDVGVWEYDELAASVRVGWRYRGYERPGAFVDVVNEVGPAIRLRVPCMVQCTRR